MNFWKIISLLFVLTVVQSCIQDIDVEVDFESKLVLNSFVSTDDVWSVNIKKTGNIFSETDSISFIVGADVVIHDITDNIMFRLDDIGSGNYVHDIEKPKVGHRYEVKVSSEGFETISAITEVPKPVAIVKKEDTVIVIDGIRKVKIDFEIVDVEYEDHYYICEFYKVLSDSTEFHNENETGVYSNVNLEQEGEQERALDSGIRYFIKNNTSVNTSSIFAFLGSGNDGDDGGGSSGSNEYFSYELSVLSVSKTFFEYTQYVEDYKKSNSAETGKVSSSKAPSNVVNGYGILGTSNKQVFSF